MIDGHYHIIDMQCVIDLEIKGLRLVIEPRTIVKRIAFRIIRRLARGDHEYSHSQYDMNDTSH